MAVQVPARGQRALIPGRFSLEFRTGNAQYACVKLHEARFFPRAIRPTRSFESRINERPESHVKATLGKVVQFVLIFAALCDVRGQTQPNSSRAGNRLHVKLGHASFISALAVSPNGTFLATAGSDRTARLWLLESGSESQTLLHIAPVSAVTFATDATLLTGTTTGDLLVWDLPTERATQRVNLGSAVQHISVSPDGGLIWCSTLLDGVLALDRSTLAGVARFPSASGVAVARGVREDGAYGVLRWTNTLALGSGQAITLEWWRASARIQTGATHQIEKRITSAALSSAATTVVVGAEDGVVHQLLGPELDEQLSVPGHRGPAESLDLSPDATSFISVGQLDHIVLIRETKTGKILRRIESPEGGALDKALYAPNGKAIVVATGEDNSAQLMRLTSGNDVSFKRTTTPVFKLQSLRSNDYLLAAGWYGATVWDLPHGKMIRAFPLSGSASAAAISPDGSHVFTGENLPYDYSKYLVALNVRTGLEIARYKHQSTITAAAYSPDRTLLAGGDTVGTIRVWDTRTHQEVQTLTGHSGNITALRFGPTPNLLLSQGSDNTFRAWDLQKGGELWREDSYGNDAEVFSPSGRLAAAWSPLRVIDVQTHRELANIAGAWANFAFANDDVLLFINERAAALESWSRATGARKRITQVSYPQSVKLIPLQGTDVLVCEAQTAKVVDWITGATSHQLQNSSCSSAGAPFVLVSRAGRTEVWNAATFRRVARLTKGAEFHNDQFHVSADGAFMVTTTRDFKTEVWDLRTGIRTRSTEDSYLRFDSARSALPALAANQDVYFVSTEHDDTPKTAINSWTLQPDSKPKQLFAQPYAVESLDVSSDGQSLLTCGGDGAMRLVSTQSGKRISVKPSSCSHAKYSADGAVIVSISHSVTDPEVPTVWSSDLSHQVAALDYRPGNVTCLAVSEDGNTVLTVESNRTAHVWDVSKGEEKRTLPPLEATNRIEAVELVLGDALTLLGLDNGEIRSWTAAGGRGPIFGGHKGPIRLLKRARNSQRVFLSIGDDGVRVWDVLKPQAIQVIESSGTDVATAALSEDGGLLALGYRNGRVRIVNVSSGQTSETAELSSYATAATFTSDNESLVVGCVDGGVRKVEIATGRLGRELRVTHSGPITWVESVGELIVATSSQGTVLWSEDGTQLSQYNEGTPIVASRTFIDPQNAVVIINAGRGVHAASLGRFGILYPGTIFREHVSSLAVSRDSRQAALGFSSGWVRVWDLTAHTMVNAFRVGEASVTGLVYAQDGTLLLSTEDGVPATWSPATSKRLEVYAGSYDLTDLDFVGDADQFVITASSDGRVRLFARDAGEELCTLLLDKKGNWLVMRSDGLFDGTDALASAVLNINASGMTSANEKQGGQPRRYPNLLAAIMVQKLAPPTAEFAGDVVPSAGTLRFNSPVIGEAAPKSEGLPTASLPPQGLGLQLLVKLFADLLNAGDRVTINDSSRIQTSPDGHIEIGTQALERAYEGQTFASAVGLTSFIIAHEIWHSRQAATHRFQDLTDEDHRLLECQADVLGAMDSVRIVLASGMSKDSLTAYAAVRSVQETVARLSGIEGSDSFHPAQVQREWAVEFGNARFASQVVTDKDSVVIIERRYDTNAPGDDEAWAQNVCKRILNYRLADQRDMSVLLRNQRRIGGRWEASVVYRNLSEHALKVSAHVRLVGTAYSALTGTPSPHTANIDGELLSFVLAPGQERIERVSLAQIELPAERVEASGIVYSSIQQENWMSVERDAANPGTGSKSSESVMAPRSEPSRKLTCVETEPKEALTARQQELGELLFTGANHALDGFQTLRRGNPVLLDLTDGSRGFATDLHLSGASEPTIIIDSENKAQLSVTLGAALARSEANQLFSTTANDLRALCPDSVLEAKNSADDIVEYRSIRFPDFSPNAEISITLLELKQTGKTQVDISLMPKDKK